MSNRVLLHIPSGRAYIAANPRQIKLFDKLAQSSTYMWSDEQVEVTKEEALGILEMERQALVREREEFEKEKELFYSNNNIEQPKTRGRKPKQQ